MQVCRGALSFTKGWKKKGERLSALPLQGSTAFPLESQEASVVINSSGWAPDPKARPVCLRDRAKNSSSLRERPAQCLIAQRSPRVLPGLPWQAT